MQGSGNMYAPYNYNGYVPPPSSFMHHDYSNVADMNCYTHAPNVYNDHGFDQQQYREEIPLNQYNSGWQYATQQHQYNE